MDKIASVMVLGGGGAMLWRLLEEPDTAHGLTQRLARVEGAPDLSAVAECLDDLTGRGVLSLDRPGASP